MTMRKTGYVSGWLSALLFAVASVAAGQPTGGGDVAARVGDHAITFADVDRTWQMSEPQGYTRAQQLFFEGRKRALDALVTNYLIEREARNIGIGVDELLKRDLPALTEPVTDAELREIYGRSPAGAQGLPFDQAKESIRKLLLQQRTADAKQRYGERLRSAAAVSVSAALDAPRKKVSVSPANPSLGPANALVEIVEFSDFECPYCRNAAPILKQLIAHYPGQVRLVWKNYPLAFHQDARPAAEAGLCAAEQHKFWEFHDAVFQRQDHIGGPDGIVSLAPSLGLNAAAFRRCLQEGKLTQRTARRRGAGGKSARHLGDTDHFHQRTHDGRPRAGRSLRADDSGRNSQEPK